MGIIPKPPRKGRWLAEGETEGFLSSPSHGYAVPAHFQGALYILFYMSFFNFDGLSQFGESAGFAAGDKNLSGDDLI